MNEPILDETNCLCDQPQPVYGDGSAVSCDQCEDQFHGHCNVFFTPETKKQLDEFDEPWICPGSIDKVPSLIDETTKAQVTITLI